MRTKLFFLFMLGVFLVLPSSLPAQAPDGDPGMAATFGPQQYTLLAGAAQTYTNTFSFCGTAHCQIVVVNGNGKESDRISSATVSLNGQQIVGPGDFRERDDQIIIPVTLAGTNQLTVTLISGKPGSFLTITVECAAPRVVLSIGNGGVSVPDQATFLSAFPIVALSADDGGNGGDGNGQDWNGGKGGKAAAYNVLVTQLTLSGGTLTSPLLLPDYLGTIRAGRSVILDADFTGGPFAPGSTYAVTVDGAYDVREEDHEWDKDGKAATYCFSLTGNFTVPPAAPGSATANTVMVPLGTETSGGPPNPQNGFSKETNMPVWVVPTAPFSPGTPTPTATAEMPAPAGDPPPVDFVVNTGMGLPSRAGIFGFADHTAEPSGAATANGVVFATANFIAAYSTNNGGMFSNFDPYTTFPHDAVGFCCDQVVQYVPSIDLFVWMLQGGGDNGYRLAVASPADIVSSGANAWTHWWNLLPSVFGATPGTGFDYPDLSVGDNYLYLSWDAGDPCPKGCNSGHQVARIKLSDLQAEGTIGIDFTNPDTDLNVAWGSHLMQDTGDEIFWAGHYNNKMLRVFSWAEGSNIYYWRNIPIYSWANNSPLSSETPDMVNWVDFLLDPTTQNPSGGFPGFSVIGATRSNDQLWFAWSAGTNQNFPAPHVEMVTLDRSDNFNLIQQVQIWSNTTAYAYPALATNGCTGEIGLSLEDGGGGKYFENHVVGFWGDFIVYTTTASNLGYSRYGDYVTLRRVEATEANPGNLFAAFGYGLNTVTPTPTTNFQSDVHYVEFGRPPASCSPVIGGNIQ